MKKEIGVLLIFVSLIFFLTFIFLLVNGISTVDIPPIIPEERDKLACNSDTDCACGRWINGDCAVGNRAYIDVSNQCPDFCGGIAGNLETKCVNRVCSIVQKSETECVKEGESLGAVIPENTKECCEGLVPFVPPNILGTRGTCQKPDYVEGEKCTSDNDCVPKECCHPTTCINKANKGACDGVMCTMECRSGTLDCGGGSCKCVDGFCTAVYGEGEYGKYSYCSRFSPDDCPESRCEVGPSCQMCEDIGCHEKGYSDNWNQ